jgi:rRNA-processing protein FCF1
MSTNDLPSYTYIILDANFLLMPIQFKIDIYSRIRDLIPGKIKLVILSEVIQELQNKVEKIEREGKVKFRLEVQNSLRFLENQESDKKDLFYHVETKREENMHVDDFIVNIAQKMKIDTPQIYIGTNDKELKQKALLKKISVVFMRNKSQLVIWN